MGYLACAVKLGILKNPEIVKTFYGGFCVC